jgi:hypothetical protein
LLAFIWIYRSTGTTQTVISLSHGIFWLVLAALPLFLIFPHFSRAAWLSGLRSVRHV